MNFYARALCDDIARNTRVLRRWFVSWWYTPTIDAMQAAMLREVWEFRYSQRWQPMVLQGMTMIDAINKALGPGEYMYSDRFGKLHVAELKVSGERPHEFLFSSEDHK